MCLFSKALMLLRGHVFMFKGNMNILFFLFMNISLPLKTEIQTKNKHPCIWIIIARYRIIALVFRNRK